MSVADRETRERWPLLTVETKANGDSRRIYEYINVAGSGSGLDPDKDWIRIQEGKNDLQK
jgi:hypothetical protein